MYKDELKYSSLAKMLQHYDYAMIDTCSLMEDSFPAWMDVLVNAKYYFEKKMHVYVLSSSIKELKKHKDAKDNLDKTIAAKRALRILKKSKWHGIISILKGNSKQNFADKEIYTKASDERMNQKILVITQDKKLASDLLELNSLRSIKGRLLSVFKLDDKGELVPNKGEDYIKVAGKRAEEAQNKTQKQKGPDQKGPSPHQTHRPDPSELNNKVVNADKRLRSLITNDTYPSEKKIEDAKALLSDLSRMSNEKIVALHLFYNQEKLKELIDSLEHPAPASVVPIPEKKETVAARPSEPEKKKDLWYEYGQTIESAIVNVSNHYGVIFRAASVPFVKEAHGDIDLTLEDLHKIVLLFPALPKDGEKVVRSYKGINFQIEKTAKGIKGWIDMKGALASSAPAKPQPEQPKPQPKKESSAKPQVEAESNPQPAPKQKKQSPAPKAEKPAQKISAEPSPKEEKPVAKKAEKPKKETPKKKAEKPAEQPKKPAKQPSPKKEDSSKKEAEKPSQQPKQPKPARPVKDSNAKNPPAPKQEAKKKPTVLEQTQSLDARLKANVNNPNYPPEQKKKDVEAQILQVKKLPVAERGKLNYDLAALKNLLKSLG